MQIQHSLGLLKGDPLRWKEVHDKQERYLRKHPSVRRSVKGPLDYVPANVEEGGVACAWQQVTNGMRIYNNENRNIRN